VTREALADVARDAVASIDIAEHIGEVPLVFGNAGELHKWW